MASFVDQIIQQIQASNDPTTSGEALLDAAFLFEKARGMAPCAWSREVEEASISSNEEARLRDAVVAFVERTGCGSFFLSKCGNQDGLKPLYIRVVRRQLGNDPLEMYQAMIALDNLGERTFPSGSASSLETSLNRQLAQQYLARVGPNEK